MIQCRAGGTRHEHATVAEVRVHYGQPSATQATPERPTAKQQRFLAAMLSKNRARLTHGRKVEDLLLAQLRPILDGLVARESRGYIGSLPEGVEPRPTSVRDERRGEEAGDGEYPVAEGLYATPSLTGNNDLDFWRVKHGRKPGVVFVNRVIGGHQDAQLPADSKRRIKTERVARVTQKSALEAILAFEGGPEASQELAGIELKFCRKCGIHLTDETSRAVGIGPVCRGRAYDDAMAAAEDATWD